MVTAQANERAMQNLLRVVQAVGATYNATTGVATLMLNVEDYGSVLFNISHSWMAMTSNIGRFETCYFYAPGDGTPWQEVIASALLILKRDPTIFNGIHSKYKVHV